MPLHVSSTMCSKHVEAWNKLIVKQKFCASSWLITKINILRCTVSKTSKKRYWYSIWKARSSTRYLLFRVQFVFHTPISFGVKYSFSGRINNESPQTSSYTPPRTDLLRKVVKLCKYMEVFFFQTITHCHTNMINGDEQTNAFMST